VMCAAVALTTFHDQLRENENDSAREATKAAQKAAEKASCQRVDPTAEPNVLANTAARVGNALPALASIHGRQLNEVASAGQ